MTKDPKRGESQDKRKRAGALLDELDSVKSLLGDAARDVPPGSVDEDDDGSVPTLTPEPGDAESQIPLLGDDPAPASAATDSQSVKDSVRQALSQRQNPFLSPPPKATPAPTPEPQPGPSRPGPARPQGKAGASLTDAEVRALADEVLAAWMPRIERELRDRLIEEIRRRADK